MFLADMMIDAIDATLEDRKVTFDRICMNIAANIFVDTVVDHAMFSKPRPSFLSVAPFVGHDESCLVHLRRQDRVQSRGGHGGNVVRAHAAALYEGEYRFLARPDGPERLRLLRCLFFSLPPT